MSRLIVHPQMLMLGRNLRAALKPREHVPLTEAERADKQLFRERRCFVCVGDVPDPGVTWSLGPDRTANGRFTVAQRFIFHAECCRRLQLAHPRVSLRELLVKARAMRAEA